MMLIAAAMLLVAPLRGAERVFTVIGVVREPLHGERLVIAHEEIPGFMAAMTMRFTVAEAARAEAAQLKAGDRVRFVLRVDEERSRAEAFKVLARAGAGGEQSAGPTPPRATAAIPRLKVGDVMPDFSLLDQEGRPLTRADLGGGLTVLTFIFTRCPVPEYCPLMTNRFAELQRAIVGDPKLGGRVRLLSISLDPAFDRPAVLKTYGTAFGARFEVWRFATGTDEEVGRLVRAFSVYREKNGVTLDHTLCTALVDADGRIVELWRGNGWKVDEVLARLRQ